MRSASGDESNGLDLPLPGDDAVEHSCRLVEKIVDRIQRNDGIIGFSDYMQMVLYEPALGYYSGGSTKFGVQGDFVTAAEISALFGQCLAVQCEQIFDQGCAKRILEFGAGSGKLCASILHSSANIERYFILEVSADLKSRQQNYLHQQLSAELFHKIEWLAALPKSFDGIVLANEVLDAMPVHILQKQDGWIELGVGYDGERFNWQPFASQGQALFEINRIESQLGELPSGYCSEVNLNYQPWMNALSQCCNRVVVLVIDYGYEQADYYHPERNRGTLICHYRHRVHANPLLYPGLQDVTAFINFDALADAAEMSGFGHCGLVSQGRFLIANGLLEKAQKETEKRDSSEQFAISQQVKTLSLATEMGEKFKVFAVQKNLQLELPAMQRGVIRE